MQYHEKDLIYVLDHEYENKGGENDNSNIHSYSG